MENDKEINTDREMTYGEKAVGLTFNLSGNKNVNKVKELYAEIIDLCADFTTPDRNEEITQMAYKAITEAQTAQMWAVKAITYKY